MTNQGIELMDYANGGARVQARLVRVGAVMVWATLPGETHELALVRNTGLRVSGRYRRGVYADFAVAPAEMERVTGTPSTGTRAALPVVQAAVVTLLEDAPQPVQDAVQEAAEAGVAGDAQPGTTEPLAEPTEALAKHLRECAAADLLDRLEWRLRVLGAGDLDAAVVDATWLRKVLRESGALAPFAGYAPPMREHDAPEPVKVGRKAKPPAAPKLVVGSRVDVRACVRGGYLALMPLHDMGGMEVLAVHGKFARVRTGAGEVLPKVALADLEVSAS